MEGVFLGSVNVGILVEKEVVVHTNDKVNGGMTVPHPPSVVSVIQSVSDLKRETTASELKEMIPLPLTTKMLPRSDVNDETPGDLAEFFRRPPPPSNFMSIPDDMSIYSAYNKWDVFKVFRKRRKRRKRQPPLIKLPDSAVSARTLSGHRYIAISIPSEYPEQLASQSTEAGPNRAVGSTRSTTSNRGKETLKPVSEDHESLSSASLAPRSATHPEGVTLLAPPPRKLSTVPSQEETGPAKGKGPDEGSMHEGGITRKVPISPLGSSRTSRTSDKESKSSKRSPGRQAGPRKKITKPRRLEPKGVLRVVDIPPTKHPRESSQQKQLARDSNEPTTNEGSIQRSHSTLKNVNKSLGTPHVLSANPLRTPELPVRTSSRTAKTTVAGPDSIPSIVNRPAPISRGVDSSNGGGGKGSGRGEAATGPRGSFAESLMTTESSPKVLKAQTATAYQSVPIVVRPPSGPKVESPLNLNFPSPPSGAAHRPVQADLLSPPAEGTRSRKDRVRERKQRDIERLKNQLRQTKPSGSHLLKPEAAAESAWPESPILGRFTQGPGPQSHRRPFLTAKMSDIGPIRPGLQLKSDYLSPEAVVNKRRRRSASAPVFSSSSSSSQLESPPMPWEGSTAYYRRRELQAEREESEAKRAQYVARALAEEKEAQDRLSRERLLRRYERLKERRARDMERRLHRLERNGEVLMQSLVSLMDTLNKVLQDRHVLQRSASSAYPGPSSASQRHRHSVPEQSQSLRSVRSYDSPLETLRSHIEQRDVGREPEIGGARGEHGEMDARVREAALEALQAQLQARRRARATSAVSGYSTSNSSDRSDEADSLEIMEPLMRELQEAARFVASRREEEPAERVITPLTESDIFNLF
ncbi:hypothetical protein GGS26DRAFT_588002 [Hypomontagnella submonticulosa]|nr:hypothetical protein GGS26DRAFT_588002 [Hypomontagnella submonticulosa]